MAGLVAATRGVWGGRRRSTRGVLGRPLGWCCGCRRAAGPTIWDMRLRQVLGRRTARVVSIASFAPSLLGEAPWCVGDRVGSKQGTWRDLGRSGGGGRGPQADGSGAGWEGKWREFGSREQGAGGRRDEEQGARGRGQVAMVNGGLWIGWSNCGPKHQAAGGGRHWRPRNSAQRRPSSRHRVTCGLQSDGQEHPLEPCRIVARLEQSRGES